jgi:Glycosyltransferases, probably involved in cell wall biogenesis
VTSTTDFLRHLGDYGLFAALVISLLVLGFIQGLGVSSAAVTVFGVAFALVWMDAAAAALVFSVFLVVSAAARIPDLRSSGLGMELDGPEVAAVVPVYRDEEVLGSCVESLLESNYQDLQIVVVAEKEDFASVREVRRLSSANDNVRVAFNTSDPSSKAGAVNHGVEQTDSPLVAVFDADQFVPPDFLPRAVAETSKHEVVQGRTVPRPNGLVESFSYYESLVFWLGSAVFNRLGFRMALSRSTVMHRSVFEEMGGYSPDTVTEDVEFGHRCIQSGVDVGRVRRPACLMEAPHTTGDLWRQKRRWVKGSLQVFVKNLKALAQTPSERRRLISLAFLGGAVLGNAFIITMVPKVLLLIALGDWAVGLTPFLTVAAICLFYRSVDVARGAVDGVGLAWLLSPGVYILYGFLSAKAFTEFLTTWSGQWHRVLERSPSRARS